METVRVPVPTEPLSQNFILGNYFIFPGWLVPSGRAGSRDAEVPFRFFVCGSPLPPDERGDIPVDVGQDPSSFGGLDVDHGYLLWVRVSPDRIPDPRLIQGFDLTSKAIQDSQANACPREAIAIQTQRGPLTALSCRTHRFFFDSRHTMGQYRLRDHRFPSASPFSNAVADSSRPVYETTPACRRRVPCLAANLASAPNPDPAPFALKWRWLRIACSWPS
jgi:hypothetical protein